MLFGKEHVDRYVATDGEEGYDWRNGQQHSTPLIFRQHGDDYLVVASKGGSDEPPAWYLNLQADRDVQVQVKGDRFAAKARPATPQEKPELWRYMTEVWPDYDAYQKRTDREIGRAS